MAAAKKTPEEFFEQLVTDWRIAAQNLGAVEREYSLAYGTALAEAEGKNAEARAAVADRNCSDLRGDRDDRRVDEQAARWAVQYHLARAGRTGRFDG